MCEFFVATADVDVLNRYTKRFDTFALGRKACMLGREGLKSSFGKQGVLVYCRYRLPVQDIGIRVLVLVGHE